MPKAARRRVRTNKKNRSVRPNKKVKFISDLIEGQVNAFSPKAKGSKQFDESSSLTNTATVRHHATLSTDSNGALSANVTFIPSTLLRQATTIVSDVVTVDGSYVSATDSTYIDTHAHLRVVSFGVRVYCIANADKAQGVLRVSSTMATINTAAFSTANDHSQYIPITKDMDFTWVSKPLGGAFHNFIPTDSSISGLATAGNVPCTLPQFFLSGGPASTPTLGIEIRVNYELLPDESDVGTYRHATKAWPSAPQLVKHVFNTLTNSPIVHDTAELAAGAAAAKIAPQVASTASSIFAEIAGFGESALEMAPLMLL